MFIFVNSFFLVYLSGDGFLGEWYMLGNKMCYHCCGGLSEVCLCGLMVWVLCLWLILRAFESLTSLFVGSLSFFFLVSL